MKKQILCFAAFILMQNIQAQTKSTSTKAAPAPKVATNVQAQSAKNTADAAIKNGKDSASYALGFRIAQSLTGQGLQKINLAVFNKGLLAGFEGKSIIVDSVLDYCIKTYQETMSAEKSAANKLAGQEFLVKNAKKPGDRKSTRLNSSH